MVHVILPGATHATTDPCGAKGKGQLGVTSTHAGCLAGTV